MADSSQLPGLDPAIFAYHRLFCVDVQRLRKVKAGIDCYMHGARHVLKAHIVGHLADIELRRSTVIYIGTSFNLSVRVAFTVLAVLSRKH